MEPFPKTESPEVPRSVIDLLTGDYTENASKESTTDKESIYDLSYPDKRPFEVFPGRYDYDNIYKNHVQGIRQTTMTHDEIKNILSCQMSHKGFSVLKESMRPEDIESFYLVLNKKFNSLLSLIDSLNNVSLDFCGRNLTGVQNPEHIGWSYSSRFIPEVIKHYSIVPTKGITSLDTIQTFLNHLFDLPDTDKSDVALGLCQGINFDTIKLLSSQVDKIL